MCVHHSTRLSGRRRRRSADPHPSNATLSLPAFSSVPRRELDRLLLIQMLEGWAEALDRAKCLPYKDRHAGDNSASGAGSRYSSPPKSDKIANGTDSNDSDSGANFDAHKCTLRLLCEVAETPSAEDLLGEALKLLLAPREVLAGHEAVADGMAGGGEYLRAQADGAIRRDCSRYRENCGIPLLEVTISWSMEQTCPITYTSNTTTTYLPNQQWPQLRAPKSLPSA